MTKFRINKFDLYVFLNMLYSFQGVLYPVGFINQSAQLVLILWGIIVFLKDINGGNFPLYLKSLTWLLAMYVIYGTALILIPDIFNVSVGMGFEIPKYIYLQNALNSILPFYVIYRYTKGGLIDRDRICIYICAYLVIYIYQYYHNLAVMIAGAVERGSNRTEFTINTGYQFMALIPFLFFFKKKTVRYILLAIIFVFIIMCMKRGAIIIGTLLGLWFIIDELRTTRNVKTRFFIVVISGAILVAGVLFVQYYYDTSEYFQFRLEQTMEGNTSGRDELADTILEEIDMDQSLTHLLIGRGPDSTVKIAGNYAHNDWLEILCNNGILGVVLAASFYVTLIISARRISPYIKKEYMVSLKMMIIVYILPTFFSMSITSMGIIKILLVSYILAMPKDVIESNCNFRTLIL